MKRLVLKTIAFLLVAQLVVALVWRGLVMYPNNYSRLTNEKNVAVQIQRMQQIQEPKMVFCGGSGMAYGLSSPTVGEYFKMPVCNTGSHAGLGLRMHLELYKKFISKGDIIIAAEEYQLYFGKVWLGEETVLRILATNYPEGFKDLSLRQQLYLFKYVPKAFSDAFSVRKLKELWGGVKLNMNECGDLVDERNTPCSVEGLRPLKIQERFQPMALGYLRDFSDYCESKGATFLIFPPACRQFDFEGNAETVGMVWKRMEEMGLPIVSTPQEYCFPDTLFCDASPYHLTNQGVEYRTEKMVRDIEAYLSNH